jgi:hypothetical protein
VPELAGLPDGLAVDGELVAFGDDDLPSFPRPCDRMLHGRKRIEVMLVVFDVLVIEGRDVIRRPYWERRQLLVVALVLIACVLTGGCWPSGRSTPAAWPTVSVGGRWAKLRLVVG